MVCDVKDTQDPSDGVKRDVVNHLVFHKSLIDEERSGERINDYLDMVENINGGNQISSDPFESAIASVFKLVIEENMDPWDIDLVSFTHMFLEEAKEKENINFITAGQLVNMAWSILKMQCEETLNDAESEEQEEQEVVQDDFISQWDFDSEMYEEPEDMDYEDEVLEKNEPILEKAVRREEKKPVSLMQLVDAFDEARKEAKYREKMERLRKEKKKEREEEEKKRNENYDSNAHKEDLHHDISVIWDRICWYDKDKLNFNMIYDGRKADLVTAFVSVLFLHKKQKIKLEQEQYPTGKIMMENLVPAEEREEGMLKYMEENEEQMALEDVVRV